MCCCEGLEAGIRFLEQRHKSVSQVVSVPAAELAPRRLKGKEEDWSFSPNAAGSWLLAVFRHGPHAIINTVPRSTGKVVLHGGKERCKKQP